MKKAIIINGFGGVGKDTFVDCVKSLTLSINLEVYNISSVDNVKRAAKVLGWDGKKDERSRKFLHDLKNLVTNYNDGNLKYMEDYYNSHGDGLYFFHVREPEEIDKVKKALNAETLYVKNDRITINNDRAEERGIEDYEYTYTVDNSGSMDDLYLEALKFLNNFIVVLEEKKAVAFDFDGVIHKYSKGWQDGSIYDEINNSVTAFMFDLINMKIPVFILSTRDPEQIVEWWNKQKLKLKAHVIQEDCTFFKSTGFIGVTNRKLPAQLYIDDRAFLYKGQSFSDLKESVIYAKDLKLLEE